MRRLSTAVLLLLVSTAEARASGRCASVEEPAAPGRPHVFLPAGVVPHTGPLEIADLARGVEKERVVTCVELVAIASPRRPGAGKALAWIVHLEAPFFVVIRGAHGSCHTRHQLLTFDDRSGQLESRAGIDQQCKMRPYDLVRGR